MLVRLDHLRKIITGTSKRNILLLQQTARSGSSSLTDLVESQLAVQVIVGVGDVDGLLRDQRVVLGKRSVGGDEGDAFEGGVDGGGVVDGEALVGDYILAFFIREVGEGNIFFVFFISFLVFVLILILILLSLAFSILLLITRLIFLLICLRGI